MRIVKKLYLAICRKVGPRGLTYSAWAWIYARETGNTRLRNFIDGIWLAAFDTHNHCQSSYQRETSSLNDA